ncbi:hypothetical protein KKC60_03950 [Patescibacteria group bacterium]|nr:hypothetical protein [Patescibacteria group bacterium]
MKRKRGKVWVTAIVIIMTIVACNDPKPISDHVTQKKTIERLQKKIEELSQKKLKKRKEAIGTKSSYLKDFWKKLPKKIITREVVETVGKCQKNVIKTTADYLQLLFVKRTRLRKHGLKNSQFTHCLDSYKVRSLMRSLDLCAKKRLSFLRAAVVMSFFETNKNVMRKKSSPTNPIEKCYFEAYKRDLIKFLEKCKANKHMKPWDWTRVHGYYGPQVKIEPKEVGMPRKKIEACLKRIPR